MSLKTKFEHLALPLEDAFTITRGTQDTAENVVIQIEDEHGNVGIGGAAPSSRYGETVATIDAVLPDLLNVVEDVGDPYQLDRIEHRMAETVKRNPAAKSAVSIALHDLVCKRLDQPLYRYWGLDPAETLETSYTIGIDTPEKMREKTETAIDRGYLTLKVKVGTGRDEELVSTVREAAPKATLRVDANEAWSPRQAVRKIEMLDEYGVEFIEQPVPANDLEGLKFVRERSALPVAADESCVTLADVPRIADCADIANLKLMKCGGLRHAIQMVHAARAHGMDVMLGCMIESNASIAAAAHLVPLLDYADLDGSLLLAEDPFDGVKMPNGKINLSDNYRPGIGATRRSS